MKKTRIKIVHPGGYNGMECGEILEFASYKEAKKLLDMYPNWFKLLNRYGRAYPYKKSPSEGTIFSPRYKVQKKVIHHD
jgi:hypothetical protein